MTMREANSMPALPKPSKYDEWAGSPAYYTAAQVQQYAIDYAAALALSRRVPEGFTVRVMEIEKNGASRTSWSMDGYANKPLPDGVYKIVRAERPAMIERAAMLAAAPAAAGAQGEEYAACCDTPAYCSSVRRCTRMDTTPQPAAADGGVRERAAVSALVSAAKEIDRQAWGSGTATITASQIKALGFARESVEQALTQQTAVSSHRQAGDEDVESAARALFEAQADPHAAPWDHQWDRTKQYWRRIARGNLYTATPPGADLSKQVASVCLVTERRLPHFASIEVQLYDGYEPKIGDRLALVEKGAGS